MGRQGRRSYYVRRQARNALGCFTITPSSPKDSDSSSTMQPRRWTSIVGAGSSSMEGSSSKSPRGSSVRLESTSSGKRPLSSSFGLEGPSSGKHPWQSTIGILGASSGKNQSHSTSAMGQLHATLGTGPSRRDFVRVHKSPNMPREIIFVDSSSDSDSANKNKQAPVREKIKEASTRAKGKQAYTRGKGKKAAGHCCTLHEWRARENSKEAAGRDKGKQCAGSEKGTEAAARGKGMLAVSSSGKHPRESSVGIEGPSSSKRPLRSSMTSTKGAGPSRWASVRNRGPSSSKGPRSPNLSRGVIFVNSNSDNINKKPVREKTKEASATAKGKQASAREKGKKAAGHCCTLHELMAREKGTQAAGMGWRKQAASSMLATLEMKMQIEVTFRFKKIKATARYTSDNDSETDAVVLSKH